MQNFSGEFDISCFVFGREVMARMMASPPTCKELTALSNPSLPPSRVRFLDPPPNQTVQSNLRWLGNSLEE